MKPGYATALAALLLATALPAAALETMDPVGTAGAFSAALAKGDAATATELLAPDVLIYESGGQESSRDEYTGHHMKGDMALLAKAQIQVIDRRHSTSGDLAWVATRSRITATHKDKALDLYSTESLVLKRMSGGWRIVHIQWSSRPVEPKAK